MIRSLPTALFFSILPENDDYNMMLCLNYKKRTKIDKFIYFCSFVYCSGVSVAASSDSACRKTFLGLLPSDGPITPCASNSSTKRAARL